MKKFPNKYTVHILTNSTLFENLVLSLTTIYKTVNLQAITLQAHMLQPKVTWTWTMLPVWQFLYNGCLFSQQWPKSEGIISSVKEIADLLKKVLKYYDGLTVTDEPN